MPELPEVHALAADLDARLRGRTVERLEVHDVAALKTVDPPLGALRGSTVSSVSRRGKFLDIALDTAGTAEGTVAPLHLVLHLARAGWIHWRAAAPQRSGRPGRSPLSARLVLDDAGLATGLATGSGFDVTEAGTKKSVSISLVRDPSHVPGIARLGPDPLDPAFTLERFAGILAGAGRRQLKGLLCDQSVIAGIGNAYSDEILHAARLSPFAHAALSPADAARLYDVTRTTLLEAISRSAGLAAAELKREKKSGLQVHGRTGEPCPVCGDTVRQVSYVDRSFQYCPTCQTRGKPLADRVLSRLLK